MKITEIMNVTIICLWIVFVSYILYVLWTTNVDACGDVYEMTGELPEYCMIYLE